MRFTRKKHALQTPGCLLDEQAANTHFAEAYRTLQVNIHFAGLERNINSVLTTSAGAGEGKTATSVNLGWTMARQGKSVVLVDCDLRRPALSRTMDSRASIGITGLIADVLGSSLNGEIKNCGRFADILILIELQKKTGKLVVRDQADTVEFFFLDGRLTDLTWLADTKEMLDDARLKETFSLHIMNMLRLVKEMREAAFFFTTLPEQQIAANISGLVDLRHILAKTVFSDGQYPYIDSSIRDALVQIDENLFILPCGTIPPNPSELAGSPRLHFLLSRLKHLYDFMIIDTPPVLPVSDALQLARHADGVILVVKSAYMNRMLIGKAIEQLQNSKANLLGLVLNQVDMKREGYYKYYKKYYSSHHEAPSS